MLKMELLFDLIFDILLIGAILIEYRKKGMPNKQLVFTRIKLLFLIFIIITIAFQFIPNEFYPNIRKVVKYSMYGLICFYYFKLLNKLTLANKN